MGNKIMRRREVAQKAKEVIIHHKCPNNNLFVVALISLIAFLLFEVFIRSYDLYRVLPPVDVPSHLLGGIVLGTGIFWVISLTDVRRKKTATLIYSFLAAGVWEVLETLEDALVYNPPHLQDKFLWDGFWDIIVTTLGALIGLGILAYLRRNTTLLRRQEMKALKKV